ncbi:MAG: hypothetical protein E7508_02170 [Ruminococcus sp.]|nr:hypothetical protein [Ruminococcus sp.]
MNKNVNANVKKNTNDFMEEMNMRKNNEVSTINWRFDSNYYRKIAKRELAGGSMGEEIYDNSERFMLLTFIAGLTDEAYKSVGIYKKLSKRLLAALNKYDGCEATASITDDELISYDILDCKDWQEDVNFWRRTAKRILISYLVTGEKVNMVLYRNLISVFANLTDTQYSILEESLILPVYKNWQNDNNVVRRIAKMILAGEKTANGKTYIDEYNLDEETLERLRKYALMSDQQLLELSEREGIFMF